MRPLYLYIYIVLSTCFTFSAVSQSIVTTQAYPQTLTALGSVTISTPSRTIDSVWIQSRGILKVNSRRTTILLPANAYNGIAYTDSVSTPFAFTIEMLDPRTSYSYTPITCGANALISGQSNAHTVRIEIQSNGSTIYQNAALPASGNWSTALWPGIFTLFAFDSVNNARQYPFFINIDHQNLRLLQLEPSSFCGLATGSAEIQSDFNILTVAAAGSTTLNASQSFTQTLLPAGSQTLIVQMVNNCIDTIVVDIPAYSPPEVMSETRAISCSQASNGELMLNISASNPYTLSFHGNTIAYPSVFPITNLASGADSIAFTDINGCILQIRFDVDTAYTDCFDIAPNAMQAGDTWDLITPSGQRLMDIYAGTTVKIFDVNGNLITDVLPWNGMYADGVQAEGVYFWIAEGNYKGNGFIHIFPKK